MIRLFQCWPARFWMRSIRNATPGRRSLPRQRGGWSHLLVSEPCATPSSRCCCTIPRNEYRLSLHRLSIELPRQPTTQPSEIGWSHLLVSEPCATPSSRCCCTIPRNEYRLSLHRLSIELPRQPTTQPS